MNIDLLNNPTDDGSAGGTLAFFPDLKKDTSLTTNTLDSGAISVETLPANEPFDIAFCKPSSNTVGSNGWVGVCFPEARAEIYNGGGIRAFNGTVQITGQASANFGSLFGPLLSFTGTNNPNPQIHRPRDDAQGIFTAPSRTDPATEPVIPWSNQCFRISRDESMRLTFWTGPDLDNMVEMLTTMTEANRTWPYEGHLAVLLSTTDSGAAVIDKLVKERDKAIADAATAAAKAVTDHETAIQALKDTHKEEIAAKDQQLGEKDGEIQTLKDAEIKPEQLDKMVADRSELIGKAKQVLGDSVNLDGKTEAEIVSACVEKHYGADALKDKNPDHIMGMFSGIKFDSVRETIMGNNLGVNTYQQPAVDHRDPIGHQKHVNDMENAWRPPNAMAGAQ